MKHRTKTAEQKYEIYKNKLISVIRANKKNYYHKLLEQHRNNIRGTWNILNGIINNGKRVNKLATYFVNNNHVITNTMEIADGFNNFFANVGSLASKIGESNNSTTYIKCLNSSSLYLRGVEENEVISIVHKFTNKRSKDFNDIDMWLVKEIINYIVTPFTYICNQSFLTGIFPDKMKTAKVIPIFKSGNKNQFTNYRPISKLFAIRLDNFVERIC